MMHPLFDLFLTFPYMLNIEINILKEKKMVYNSCPFCSTGGRENGLIT